MNCRRSVLVIAVLSTLVASGVHLTPSAMAQPAYGRAYALNTLDTRTAEVLVWDLCKGLKDESCMVQAIGNQQINVHGTVVVQEAVTRMLAERDLPIPTSLAFHVALVQASRTGKSQLSGVSKGIDQAIAATRELLPYEAFYLSDQAVMRTTSRATSRMSGREGEGYICNLQVLSAIQRTQGLELSLGLEIVRTDGPNQGNIFNTTLAVRVGETVIAGSSQVGGGDALLVLVTALAE